MIVCLAEEIVNSGTVGTTTIVKNASTITCKEYDKHGRAHPYEKGVDITSDDDAGDAWQSQPTFTYSKRRRHRLIKINCKDQSVQAIDLTKPVSGTYYQDTAQISTHKIPERNLQQRH